MSLVLFLSLATVALGASDGVFEYTPLTLSTLDLYNVTNTAPFQVYDADFHAIIGTSPTITAILNSTNATIPAQFHEAGILFSSDPNPVMFITSNQFVIPDSPSTNNKSIAISRVSFDGSLWTSEFIEPTEGTMALANGGARYKDGVILLDQGSLTTPGGIVFINGTAPYGSKVLLDNYLGTEFNSPNDVHVTQDGALWFTDPDYGSWQGIRPAPQLPNAIYRFMPDTAAIRVVAAGLLSPNGITFSPDEKTAYITDGAGNTTNPTAPRAIYAYDVLTTGNEPYLGNQRIFAMPQKGLPDGIKTDANGNVYAGCGDGVNVWNAGGKLLGKVVVEGGASNFVLGPHGELWILAEGTMWEAKLAAPTATRADAAVPVRRRH